MRLAFFRATERQFRIEVLIYAFLAAMSSVMLSRTLNRNIVLKNEMIILETRLADQWSFYQAKSTQYELFMMAKVNGKEAEYAKAIEDSAPNIQKRRDEAFNEARDLEAKRKGIEDRSSQYSGVIQNFSLAVTLLQIALLLTSMMLITSSPIMHIMGIGTGFAGGCVFLHALGLFLTF